MLHRENIVMYHETGNKIKSGAVNVTAPFF